VRAPIWLDIFRTSGWLFAGLFFGLWMWGDTIVVDREMEPTPREAAMAYVFDPDRIYQAHIVDIVDGDTLDMVFDTGFGNTHRDRIRLYGIDTPETYGVKKDSEEYVKGKAATEYVANRLASRMTAKQVVWVETVKRGKFGRYLGIIWINKDDLGNISKSLNAELLNEGHAKLYKSEPLPLDE
jgi:micrococcal nuclease